MCGIAGFLLTTRSPEAPEPLLERMTHALAHRGPDGWGAWWSPAAGVGLGHRRLAVVDLSAAGRQPMRSASGRFTIVFNGEIYNFQLLRAELEKTGVSFTGHSDTEVMLALFEQLGVERALPRLAGMFAFALWDEREQALYLARDRLGKKPLYHAIVRGSLVFGSELKALRQFPGFDPEVDREALTMFLRHNYVPTPHSIYKSARKLPPATYMKVQKVGQQLRCSEPIAYWSAEDAFRHRDEVQLPDDEAVANLDTLLRDAVQMRMIADVPLGAFLSGGVDSSLIVALMQAQSSRRVKTFTIGFHDQQYDEAPYAKSVAQHLGTDHTEVYLSSADALAVIPSLPSMFDEPFADSSQIPTFLVSRVARRDVTVALSGDGGDELFCGYERYFRWRRVWSNLQRMPGPLRRSVARMLVALPAHRWERVVAGMRWMLPTRLRDLASGDKFHKLAEVLNRDDPGAVYLRFVSHWTRPDAIVLGAHEPATILTRGGGPHDLDGFTERMMLLDTLTYLPDDILVKVDRASMAVSLEARAPLLDHRVVEYAAGLRMNQKFRNGRGKWALRQVLSKYVPDSLIDRPKMGFGIPLAAWLRGSLRDWAEDLLSEQRLRRDGFFDPQPIRDLWAAHLSGRQDAHYLLWDVLMFQAWQDENRLASASRAA